MFDPKTGQRVVAPSPQGGRRGHGPHRQHRRPERVERGRIDFNPAPGDAVEAQAAAPVRCSSCDWTGRQEDLGRGGHGCKRGQLACPRCGKHDSLERGS